MATKLICDVEYCAKCKICKQKSKDFVQFTEDNYPLEMVIEEKDLPQAQMAVDACPIKALSLISG